MWEILKFHSVAAAFLEFRGSFEIILLTICLSNFVTCADVSQLICRWINLNQTPCISLQAQLAAAIPKVGASSSSSASSPAVQELRKLMEQVDTIKAERDAIEQDLKVQQDDMGELREIPG